MYYTKLTLVVIFTAHEIILAAVLRRGPPGRGREQGEPCRHQEAATMKIALHGERQRQEEVR